MDGIFCQGNSHKPPLEGKRAGAQLFDCNLVVSGWRKPREVSISGLPEPHTEELHAG